MKQSYEFPKAFIWGSANASFQVEGAINEDGRGPSIWDEFCRQPGHIKGDQHADITADMYHRYQGDVKLMKDVGLKAYRFSVAWPRIFPQGDGAPNEKGVDYYNRLTDELLAQGIEPWITLFHWDLPQAMEDRFGGWRSRETAKRFGDYCHYVAQRLSDRVKNWFTINEFWCYTDAGYAAGCFAPGLKLSMKELYEIRHVANLGHGLAVQGLRAGSRQPANIGIAQNAALPVPVYETDEHIAAVKTAWRIMNGAHLTPILEGRYPQEYLDDMGADAPVITDEEMKVISSPMDFVGVNLYSAIPVIADAAAPHGYRVVPWPESHPRVDADINVCPQSTYWLPRMLKEIWGVKAVYITENGAACKDKVTDAGTVEDIDRVMYLRQHFISAHRAVMEGWPLKGYFVWSFLDNYEWINGFTQRYGLIHVNYDTLQRTPKLSARYYAECIRRNGVV
jgi:beta-glucosidase